MVNAMKFFDPPPLRYFGSKWQLADWIIEQMPAHGTYVEPFCGGASVFFRKQPSPIEVLNDRNGDLVNFFDVLRSQSDELVRLIDLTPWSRLEYQRSFEPCDDALERARRFYVRCWQSFRGGGASEPSSWSYRVDEANRSSSKSWSRMEGLILGAKRLKQAQLEYDDAPKVIRRYDTPDTLFYIDPPYVQSSRQRKANRYIHEMSDDDHRHLADVLHQVQGMVLLSGYKSSLYDDLYSDWHCTTKTNTTNGNSTSVEYLWISPRANDLQRLPLFG